MLAFKEFFLFHPATLEAMAVLPPGNAAAASDWTTTHHRYTKVGYGQPSSSVRSFWRSIFIPKEKDFELVSGLDEAARAEIDLAVGLTMDTCSPAMTDCDLIHNILDDPAASPKTWHKYKVTGRHYNGTNEWDDYPVALLPAGVGYGDVQVAQLPKLFTFPFRAHQTGVGIWLNTFQEQFFRLGVIFLLANFSPAEPNAAGEEFSLSCELLSWRVYYFNPIVNSLSVKYAKTTGNKELILTGLGFNNSNADLDYGAPVKAGGWSDEVDYIHFIGLQKQGLSIYIDDFEDAIRDGAWTDDPNNGTITESGNVLTLAIANGVDGNWWQGVKNAPFAYLTPASNEITVITKLNSFTLNDRTMAGLMIGNTLTIPDTSGGHCIAFERSRYDGGSKNGLVLADIGKETLAYVSLPTLPVWLRIRAESSGAGSVINFDYSTNGADWINLHTVNDLTWSLIGLHAKNWNGLNAISAPFEFFKYEYDIPSATLSRLSGDFTLDSNTQITIPAGKFPTLAKGTYEIQLEKRNHDIGEAIFAYAGDWRTDPNGRIYKGTRFTFLIDDEYVEKGFRSKRSPIMLVNMSFKNKQGTVSQKPIAEMDVRTSNKIYEGLLLNYSNINRAVNDKAGTFKGTSMDLDLSNHKKDYSKILHDYPVLKNQEVEIAIAQMDEPESWKLPLLKMIVDDYHLKGTSFKVTLKDLVQKIFNKSVPKRICTKADYPNLSDDYVGAAMPEVLGLNTLGVGKYPGAVEAIHVDTVNHIYLASYRTLKSIDTVYSEYTAVGGWTVFYDHGGRTYIDFGADQEDKIITFDCKGCLFNDWNSVNGYVENPAYILLYYIAKIMEVRSADFDRYSFDEVAALFESIAEETSGRLIIQNTQRSSSEMKQLLFDYEIKAFVATDGRLEIGRKDISNFESDLLIFDQADLQESADRKWNQDESINRVKVESDYYPAADFFKSGQEDEKVDIIEEIDETREDTRERDREDRRGSRRRRA